MKRKTRKRVACAMAAVAALTSWLVYPLGIEWVDPSVRLAGSEQQNHRQRKGGRNGRRRN